MDGAEGTVPSAFKLEGIFVAVGDAVACERVCGHGGAPQAATGAAGRGLFMRLWCNKRGVVACLWTVVIFAGGEDAGAIAEPRNARPAAVWRALESGGSWEVLNLQKVFPPDLFAAASLQRF